MATNRLMMYQGNLVEVLEVNGCVRRVKLALEPSTKSFAVLDDALVELEQWLEQHRAGEVEGDPETLRIARMQVDLREKMRKPNIGLKVNVMEPGRTIR